MRYAYDMKIDPELVWDMKTKDLFTKSLYIESFQAEDRYILQRQLDNHVKVNNKKTIQHFGDIYKEFLAGSRRVTKIKKRQMTKDEALEYHKRQLKKLGL